MQPSWHFFWSGPFSQWQACTIVVDGKTFNCAEQAMMHAKAELFGDHDAAKAIVAATDPGRQKALGRTVRDFDEATWDTHKVAIVHRINIEKFRQNKGLRRKLFQTGDAIMVEASPLDRVWGIGLDADQARATTPEEWPGQNLLGTILTEVKAAMTAEFPEEAALIAADH